MGDHPVVGTHSEPVDVPTADHGLHGFGLGEVLRGSQSLDEAGELRDRGDIGDDDAARSQSAADRVESVPGGEHIEDDPVDGTGGEGLREGLGEVADGDRPVLGLTIEEVGDVAGRDRGEFLTDFEGVDAAGRSDGAQQGHRQRSGADPGLDDGGTGVDVAEGDDES